MNRREFVLTSTAGVAALAGCSGSEEDTDTGSDDSSTTPAELAEEAYSGSDAETRNEVRQIVEEGNSHVEQATRDLGDANAFINQERWGNAEGSARDAADSFSDAEGEINTAINRAEGLDDRELVRFLEDYQAFLRAGLSAATSFEQGASAMVDGDRQSALSHFERADDDIEDMERYEQRIEDANVN